MKENSLLIVFQKNPIEGRVKTRLAHVLGNKTALEIYKILIKKTREAVNPLRYTVAVYYSDYAEQNDLWDTKKFLKKVQLGEDLGIRMQNAFLEGFRDGYNKICLIGTDCYQLNKEIMITAFEKLSNHDFVIGPAQDGGYYLLGMKEFFEPVFMNKPWSTSSVFNSTVKDLKNNNKSFYILKELVDVDKPEDVEIYPELKKVLRK